MAAQVAHTFKMDPVEVLHADFFDWCVRVAAATHISHEKKKAAEAAKPK